MFIVICYLTDFKLIFSTKILNLFNKNIKIKYENEILFLGMTEKI